MGAIKLPAACILDVKTRRNSGCEAKRTYKIHRLKHSPEIRKLDIQKKTLEAQERLLHMIRLLELRMSGFERATLTGYGFAAARLYGVAN